MKKGFTLIELLVVVLIIGILSAVALPQYKLAVVKARASSLLPVIRSMAEASERYYLANGSYGGAPEVLDIDMPSSCVHVGAGGNFQCDDNFIVDFCGQQHCVRALYCPGKTALANCNNEDDFIIWKYFQHQTYAVNKQGQWACTYKSDLGKKICNSLHFN